MNGSSSKPDEDAVSRLIRAQVIAVVGISDDPSRAGCYVPEYLHRAGKKIIPVNPKLQSWKGLPCHPSLEDVQEKIDLVNVFRRSEFCADVARSAAGVGAKGIWLQSGIMSAEAAKIAEDAGMDFVQNRCLMIEHGRYGG